MQKTIGQSLSDLRARAGLSLADVATAAGYKAPSGVQVFFSPEYNPESLSLRVAHRLATALGGKGEPPIDPSEIYQLTRLPQDAADGIAPRGEAGPRYSIPERQSPLNVPLFAGPPGTLISRVPFLGELKPFKRRSTSSKKIGDTLVEREVFALDFSRPMGAVRRPPVLDGRDDVFAVRFAGESMAPRFRSGDILYIDPRRSPGVLDDILVEVADEATSDHRWFMLKTVGTFGMGRIGLEQYNPPAQFLVSMDNIRVLGSVIPQQELLSQ